MYYEFTYFVNNKEYLVKVTKKRMKNIHYRFKDGCFLVSCHPFVNRVQIIKGLDRFASGLISRDNKTKAIGEDYIYLFGEKYSLDNPIVFNGIIVNYSSKEELMQKLKKLYKEYVTSRVRYFEALMNVPEYKVRVQQMSTRYGSNSKKSHSLNFSLVLMHYSMSIIDSVVVHELAHYYEFNHSKNFYNVVYKYCPNYDYLHKCLRKGVFHD
mgnify:CR=1 FL=1